MRFFTTNLIDASGVTITGSSSASASLGASNVAHEHKAKVWRTDDAAADETITFDLVSSQAATSAIIFAHTLLGTDSLIQLRKSTDNFAANDVLVGSFTWASGPLVLTFSSASSRYWRVAFTKASAGVTRDIGRIFLGTYTDIENVIDFTGLDIDPQDMSVHMTAAGGQDYTDVRNQYRNISLSLDSFSTTDKDTIRGITDTTGTHQAFFFQVFSSGTTEEAEAFYVKFRKIPGRKVSGINSGLVWDSKMELKEQL